MRQASGSVSPRSATRRSTTCSARSSTRQMRRASHSAASSEATRTTGDRVHESLHRHLDRQGRLLDPAFDSSPAPAGRSRCRASTSTRNHGRSMSLFVDEAGQLRSPTCSRPGRAPAHSSCSATRTSCRRCRRARIRRDRASPSSSTCSEITSRSRRTEASSSPRPGASGPSCATSPRTRTTRVRLEPAPVTSLRSLAAGDGPVWLAVPHERRSQSSVEEADAVAAAVARLVGSPFTGDDGVTRPLRADEVLVVAPYNAQVRTLRSRLPAAVAVGTVDKFQGQQAPVVIVSMASSTADEAPRGLGFAFDRTASTSRPHARSAARSSRVLRRCSMPTARRSSRCGSSALCAGSWSWRRPNEACCRGGRSLTRSASARRRTDQAVAVALVVTRLRC